MQNNHLLKMALVSCIFFAMPGISASWAQSVDLSSGVITDKQGRLNFKVTNNREFPIEMIFSVEDRRSKTKIPTNEWRTNINPSAKDDDTIFLHPKEFRYVSLQVKDPGHYYVCYKMKSKAAIQASSCRLIEFISR